MEGKGREAVAVSGIGTVTSRGVRRAQWHDSIRYRHDCWREGREAVVMRSSGGAVIRQYQHRGHSNMTAIAEDLGVGRVLSRVP